MSSALPTTGRELVDRAAAELSEVEAAIRGHRFLTELERGSVSEGRLRAIAGEQAAIIATDRRSFEHLAARFPGAPAGEFFDSMATGEAEALRLLAGYAGWLRIDEGDLAAYEPLPDAQAYPSFVARMALGGTRSDVVLAFLVNLAAWGENCGRVAAALRSRYEAGDDAVAFFDFFAAPPPGFEDRAVAVLDAGLAAGDDPRAALRATRLLQAYELKFWEALAEGID